MTQKLVDSQKEAILKTIPLQRLGSSSEVSEVVKFLASDAASYITGEIIHVNGGMFMRENIDITIYLHFVKTVLAFFRFQGKMRAERLAFNRYLLLTVNLK